MKLLSLRRPWPWAIFHAGKRVENRVWLPNRQVIGQAIAIQAGLVWDADGAAWIEETIGVPVPPEREHPSGVVVGVVRLGGLDDCAPDDPWAAEGQHHWRFDKVLELPKPVTCIGVQGLREVPDEVHRAIAAQWPTPTGTGIMLHHCHARDCRTPCKPELLMCLHHWRMVPRDLQREIWRHYRPGQCDDKQPSAGWHAAADAAIRAVAEREASASTSTGTGSRRTAQGRKR
jgi:hypothetical protein